MKNNSNHQKTFDQKFVEAFVNELVHECYEVMEPNVEERLKNKMLTAPLKQDSSSLVLKAICKIEESKYSEPYLADDKKALDLYLKNLDEIRKAFADRIRNEKSLEHLPPDSSRIAVAPILLLTGIVNEAVSILENVKEDTNHQILNGSTITYKTRNVEKCISFLKNTQLLESSELLKNTNVPDSCYYGDYSVLLIGKGQGVISLTNGTMYDGSFMDGKLNGKGFLRSPNYSYNGEFKDGLGHDEIIIRRDDGILFPEKPNHQGKHYSANERDAVQALLDLSKSPPNSPQPQQAKSLSKKRERSPEKNHPNKEPRKNER